MTLPTLIEMPAAPGLADDAPRHLGALLALVGGEERPLPLVSVAVRAVIGGDACRTEIEQRFANPHDIALEAVHIFPLPPGGALTEMSLVAGKHVVRAECRARDEAEAAFEGARRAGRRAGLLTAERADVHTLRVTGLPPHTEAVVRMVVLERLAHADGRFLWRFPTVIAPRYVPGQPVGHDGSGVLPDTDHVPDASRLQPPLRLAGGTTLDLEVTLEGPIVALESSLHAVRVDLADTTSVRVAPSGRATLDRDFVLAFSRAETDRPSARACTDGDHTLVVVEPPQLPAPALPRDAVFVVDISGSMAGIKMVAARQALSGALHGLVPGDRFLLLAFDTVVERFADGFVDYTDEAVGRADAWITRLDARGGTEMLPAVQAALAGTTPPGRLRTVLLVTDGEVWDDAELVAAVAGRRGDARFFTLGVDTSVNAALLDRLARVGGGTCELVTPSDDIEAAVARLEARFGSPLVDEIRAEAAEPADGRPATLFAGRPVSFLVAGSPAEVRLSGRAPGGPWSAVATPAPSTLPLGPLWARERVAALEDRIAIRPFEEEALRTEILRVALDHRIASRFTAFVAVDETVTTQGERLTVVQPVELPFGWDGRFLEAPTPAPQYGSGIVASQAIAAAPTGMLGTRFARLSRLHLSEPDSEAYAVHANRAPSAPPDDLDEGMPSDLGSVDWSSEVAPVAAAPRDPVSTLAARVARAQGADGSFGGDAARTAAALVALVLLGHTRVRGVRRRVVTKAAGWLSAHSDDVRAAFALDLLARAEGGEDPDALRAVARPEVAGWAEFGDYAEVIWPTDP